MLGSTSGFGVIFRKSLPDLRVMTIYAVFSSRSFVVITLKFSPRIHFELIFVYGIR